MAIPSSKSSYVQIADDALFDINDSKTDAIPENAFIGWIIEAERRICEEYDVRETYQLGLNAGVEEYNIQDRPNISGVSNTTPIVITAVGHGLTTGDRVLIRDVRGNTAANGTFQVTVLTADTFQLFGWVDVEGSGTTISENAIGIRSAVQAVTAGVLTVTYSSPLSSSTYALDARFYDSDGSWVLSTVYSSKTASTFTITIPDTGTLTYVAIEAVSVTVSGSVTTTLANTIGSGTYTGGGKFWRDDEIPTYFRPSSFEPMQRSWSTYKPEIRIVDVEEFTRQSSADALMSISYSDMDAPFMAMEKIENGERILEFHPEPVSSHYVTVSGKVQINARRYQTDDRDCYIQLPMNFDEAITAFLKAKIYYHIKQYELSAVQEGLAKTALGRLRLNKQSHPRMNVSWK